MDKQFTRMWNVSRNEQYLEWACWLGDPMLYDGGLFVNRTLEEHVHSRYLK